jgi:hypothetical protein
MRAEDGKFHFVYRTENAVTGRFYIGKHTTRNLDDGYLGSGKRLKHEIRKYGKSNFTRTIIQFYENEAGAFSAEQQMVNEAILTDSRCLNLKRGGCGFHSADIKKLWEDPSFRSSIIEKNIAIWADEDRRKRVAEKVASWWTQERKEQQSVLKKQHNADPSTIERIAVATKEALSSSVVVEKMSSSKRRNWEDPQYRSAQIASQNRGKQTIQYAEAQRSAKIGERNPNFGTRWIHNPSLRKSTRIMKTEEVPEGWIAGRRIYK